MLYDLQLSITARSADVVDASFRLSHEPRPERPPWAAGAHVASEQEPRVVIYPNFLSDAEADHMLDLARWGAMEVAAAASFTEAPEQATSWDGDRPARAAESGQTVSIHLPAPCDDATIQAIEERCAAVTGIPIHGHEEQLGVRHTSPSSAAECSERFCTALHVDTNQGGTHRCATVLLYLHDLECAVGGETRFPLVGAASRGEAGQQLRRAARDLAGLGVTAFSPSEAVPFPPLELRRTLLDAAEAEGIGLRVRPRKGLAAVFWTHTADGLDPHSWHAGARLPPHATGGKLLAQKFKSVPRGYRPPEGHTMRLPTQLAPPVV